MGFFQRAYDWVQAWKTPVWYSKWTREIWDMVVYPALAALGNEVVDSIRSYIIRADREFEDNREKFTYVYNNVMNDFEDFNLSEGLVNLAIEIVLQQLKKQRFI